MATYISRGTHDTRMSVQVEGNIEYSIVGIGHHTCSAKNTPDVLIKILNSYQTFRDATPHLVKRLTEEILINFLQEMNLVKYINFNQKNRNSYNKKCRKSDISVVLA